MPPRSVSTQSVPRPDQDAGNLTMDVQGLRRAKVNRLSDTVADQIQELIISQNLVTGARLPAERELAERLGASRPTVSQALRKLALMGLVESRRGSGAYVTRQPQSTITASINLMLDLAEDSVAHLTDLHVSLERLGIDKAVTSGDELDFAAVAAALEGLRRSTGETAAWIRADTRFHVEVIRLGGNPYLTSIFESVHSALIAHQYQRWVEDETVPGWLTPEHADAQVQLHEPILEAIRSRDPEWARSALQHHHTKMTEHLSGADA